MRKVDLTGKTFSMLTVIKEVEPLNGKKRYLCKCTCGKEFEKSYVGIILKGNKSCGCMAKQWQAEAQKTHGQKYTKLYSVWQGVKSRSVNSGRFLDRKEHSEYKRKQIMICEEWLKFENFYKWAIENGYKENIGISIDRRDNEKGYYPGNCRWTNSSIQSQNTKVLWETNKTGYRGVSLTKRHKNPYRTIIYVNKKQINLGSYSTALEAAIAYDSYVLKNNLEHNINNVLNSHAQKEIRATSDSMKELIGS